MVKTPEDFPVWCWSEPHCPEGLHIRKWSWKGEGGRNARVLKEPSLNQLSVSVSPLWSPRNFLGFLLLLLLYLMFTVMSMQNTEFILTLLFINCCTIFHMNNYKPTFVPLRIFYLTMFFLALRPQNDLSRGVQTFGVSTPHWKKKSCLGPHIKYIATHNNKKTLLMF